MSRLRRYRLRSREQMLARLPGLAGAMVFAVGLVNFASALTPNIAWRHHLLLRLEPIELVPIFHTLAVPLSVALVVVAFNLRARRHRAWRLAIGLLLVLGAVALLKGLDFEEAVLSWSAAAALWWGRDAFVVRHRPLRPEWPLIFALGTAGVVSAGLLVWSSTWLEFHDELEWGPVAVGALCILTILLLTHLVFRPLGSPRQLPDLQERRIATGLVRAHGHDTLAFFKLRQDAQYFFSDDRTAFLGYRVANGVMLIAGDPVGPWPALPGLVRGACAFAGMRGLRVAVLGASRQLVPLYREAGLRVLYLGDEAVVETGVFSLEGRWIRKVRQSVNRAVAAGYTGQLLTGADLDQSVLNELEAVSALWRKGAAERGFSMAMDSLHGEHCAGSVVVAARDNEGRVRAFVQFVPSYGRPAVSLSCMRRDDQTPNGLMEFLVVRSIELLRQRGVHEVSLNFAAFARWQGRPGGRGERVLGRAVSLASPFFQIESLRRFNAKFGPRWEPRYLVVEGMGALPRVGLAAMRIEGQFPKLRS